MASPLSLSHLVIKLICAMLYCGDAYFTNQVKGHICRNLPHYRVSQPYFYYLYYWRSLRLLTSSSRNIIFLLSFLLPSLLFSPGSLRIHRVTIDVFSTAALSGGGYAHLDVPPRKYNFTKGGDYQADRSPLPVIQMSFDLL